MKSYLKFLKGMAVLGLACGVPFLSNAEEQNIKLSSQGQGWNLIGFQVIPGDPSPETVFTNDAIIQVWSYDAKTETWGCYKNPKNSNNSKNSEDCIVFNELMPLGPIKAGAAYWVQISQQKDVELKVSGKPVSGRELLSLNFEDGWNLFSFPMGIPEDIPDGTVKLSSLFPKGFAYDALVTYVSNTTPTANASNPTVNKQSIQKTTSNKQGYQQAFFLGSSSEKDRELTDEFNALKRDEAVDDFSLIANANSGYWIHVTSTKKVCPTAEFLVRDGGDKDNSPEGNFPGIEDINISGVKEKSTPKGAKEQDRICFFEHENSQTLEISNNGGGVLTWKAEWISTEKTPEPWIRLFRVANEVESRNIKNGKLLKNYTMLSGTTFDKIDAIHLRADRKYLTRGSHSGILRITTNVDGTCEYKVVVDVAGLSGAFVGFAEVKTVNQKQNQVPDIDLNLSLYEDKIENGTKLRGFIDSESSILWPVDVPLIGYRVSPISEARISFVLSGSYVLSPGDLNVEPFDVFNTGDAVDGSGDDKNDIDWNGNDKMDNDNPFPFPIQRSIQLVGEVDSNDPVRGYVLKGDYTEIIHGMTKEPILLKGKFKLARKDHDPFRMKIEKSTAVDDGKNVVVNVKNNNETRITSGKTQTMDLKVNTEMELYDLQVHLQFKSLPEYPKLKVSLKAPGENAPELLIYEGTKKEDQLDKNKLLSILFLDKYPIRGDVSQDKYPIRGDLKKFLREVKHTKTVGNEAWKLIFENNSSENMAVSDCQLCLVGQPVSDVYCLVKDENGDPVEGAKIVLSSINVNYCSKQTTQKGMYKLERIPLLPLNFTVTKENYDSDGNVGLSDDFKKPFAAAIKRGIAIKNRKNPFQFTELEKKTIEKFNPLAGAPAAEAQVFGFDFGTEKNPFELRIKKEAESGGKVTPTPTPVPDENTQKEIPSKENRNQKYGIYCFQTAFNSAGSLPIVKSGTTQSGTDHYVSGFNPVETFFSGDTNQFGAAYVSLTTIQHAYTASMDIDLAPKLEPAVEDSKGNIKAVKFESDGFSPLKSKDYEKEKDINFNEQGFKNEDFKYSFPQALWMDTCTTTGELEYVSSGFSNDFLVWGNISRTPFINYASLWYDDRNGLSYSLNTDSDEYHPAKDSFKYEDINVDDGDESWQVVNFYNMACSIGGSCMNILTAPTPASSVSTAKMSRLETVNPQEEEIMDEAPNHKASNSHYQLQTGIFVDIKSGKI